jgi:FKBP-type peptidyl-prolyl cis-trans isomerase 2
MAVKNGDTVKVHYTGTLTDGTEFDSCHKRNEPIEFSVGAGQMIKGFDDAVVGMEEGDEKRITISPTEAYGEVNEQAIMTIPRESLSDDFNFSEGDMVNTQTQTGQQLQATIRKIEEEQVTLDFNHPLAGQELNFDLELVEIV